MTLCGDDLEPGSRLMAQMVSARQKEEEEEETKSETVENEAGGEGRGKKQLTRDNVCD